MFLNPGSLRLRPEPLTGISDPSGPGPGPSISLPLPRGLRPSGPAHLPLSTLSVQLPAPRAPRPPHPRGLRGTSSEKPSLAPPAWA